MPMGKYTSLTNNINMQFNKNNSKAVIKLNGIDFYNMNDKSYTNYIIVIWDKIKNKFFFFLHFKSRYIDQRYILLIPVLNSNYVIDNLYIYIYIYHAIRSVWK